MKLHAAILLGTLTVACFAQTVKAKLPPPQKLPQQVTTGDNSPAIQNVSGDAQINYQAQAKPAAIAEPTVADLKRELAIQKIKTAIAQAQTAEVNVPAATQLAQQQATKLEKIAQDLIVATQKDLGLDDRYEWNFQAGNFVMKPQVGQPPQQAAPPKK